MCIVIDANVLALVFSEDDDPNFVPVRDWILHGQGKMVIGGTKYLKELGKLTQVLKLVRELSNNRKVHRVDKDSVDELEEVISKMTSSKCDDQHLIALIGVSRCPLICTNDRRADTYLKDSKYYPWKSFSPSVYRYECQKKQLLTNENASCRIFTCLNDNPTYPKFKKRVGAR